jgi:hypothetical protein
VKLTPKIKLAVLLSSLAIVCLMITVLSACQSDKTDSEVKTLPIEIQERVPMMSNSPAMKVAVQDYMPYHRDAVAKGMPSGALLLLITVSNQTMVLTQSGREVKRYTVSTSAYGTGSSKGSNMTPLGLHKVNERIGEGEPEGKRFISRNPVNMIVPPANRRQEKSEDMVLSRILWLSGMEDGKNRGGDVDSHARCIYIHGTDQEHLLGKPASHGCIRMGNGDVVELFRLIKDRETWCWIVE